MQRRDFIKTLALAAPLLFLPKLEPVKWKRSLRSNLYVINPEWVQAKYEVSFIKELNLLPPTCFIRWKVPGFEIPQQRMPMRFNRYGPDGRPEWIWPVIQA